MSEIQCEDCNNFTNSKCKFNLVSDDMVNQGAIFCATFSPRPIGEPKEVEHVKAQASRIENLLERQEELLKPHVAHPTQEMAELERRIERQEKESAPAVPAQPTAEAGTLEDKLYMLSLERRKIEDEIAKLKEEMEKQERDILAKCREKIIASVQNPNARISVTWRKEGKTHLGDFSEKEFRRLREEGYLEKKSREVTIVKFYYWWSRKTLDMLHVEAPADAKIIPSTPAEKIIETHQVGYWRSQSTFDRLWPKIKYAFETNDFIATDSGDSIRFQNSQLRMLLRDGICVRPKKGIYQFTPEAIERIKERLAQPTANPK